MPVSPKEALKALKEMKAKRKVERAEKKKENKEILKTRDLYRATIKFGKEEFPIMNALAWDVLDNYYNPINNVDFSVFENIGIILYVLEHQHDETLLEIDKKQLLRKGKEKLITLPVTAIPDFIDGIQNMFDEIKKKLNGKLMTEIQNFQTMQKMLLEDSDSSALDSLKDSIEELRNSIPKKT